MHSSFINAAVLFASLSTAAVVRPGKPIVVKADVTEETRTIDEIYQAALAEGGVVTCWHGGDEKTQRDAMKATFEKRFPGMTLNVTVDLSKYHDTVFDTHNANNVNEVDSIILQTLHDYPRWKQEGVLLNYAPANFSQIYPDFKDADAAYHGVYIIGWSNIVNTGKQSQGAPVEFTDFLKPEFKDKIVLTYPNDDDAVLFAFDLIMQTHGNEWFESLLAQNPRWVRGTATPVSVLATPGNEFVTTFTASLGVKSAANATLQNNYPTQASFVTWPQTAAIPKNAPHPEAAKLLHNFLISEEYQTSVNLWTVRQDLPPPAGFPAITEMPGTNAAGFKDFMADRDRVERLRFFFEQRIGTAQGLSPLEDEL